jgi:hypothetical protein
MIASYSSVIAPCRQPLTFQASISDLYLAVYRVGEPRHAEHMEVEKYVHFIWKAKWKGPPGKPKRSWGKSINTGLEGLHYENLKLTQLAGEKVFHQCSVFWKTEEEILRDDEKKRNGEGGRYTDN